MNPVQLVYRFGRPRRTRLRYFDTLAEALAWARRKRGLHRVRAVRNNYQLLWRGESNGLGELAQHYPPVGPPPSRVAALFAA